MKQYLDICQRIINEGTLRQNRTGTDTLGIQGVMMQFDMADGFPVVTTKKLAYKSAWAEMLGFLRGYDNAADFRRVGTKVWDANANENQQWLNNPNRLGKDDLGRIYGVQARGWHSNIRRSSIWGTIDQLQMCVDDLSKGIDNRREIVSHWNPGEMDEMALPPCHLLYQFGLEGERLNLTMYQRSADFPLGVPFNIAGYSWLLHVIARITGHTPGMFTHFIHDAHIYVDQIDLMKQQLKRDTFALPKFEMKEHIKTLEDLEQEDFDPNNDFCTVDDFMLVGYAHHPAIKYPFSV